MATTVFYATTADYKILGSPVYKETTLSRKFDDMAVDANNCNTVELEYKYRRKDGKEGAYWLSDVRIID